MSECCANRLFKSSLPRISSVPCIKGVNICLISSLLAGVNPLHHHVPEWSSLYGIQDAFARGLAWGVRIRKRRESRSRSCSSASHLFGHRLQEIGKGLGIIQLFAQHACQRLRITTANVCLHHTRKQFLWECLPQLFNFWIMHNRYHVWPRLADKVIPLATNQRDNRRK